MRGCSSIYIANEKLLFGFLCPSLPVVGTAAFPHLILSISKFLFFFPRAALFHRREALARILGRRGCGMVARRGVFSVSVASTVDAAQYFNAFSRIIYHTRARYRNASARVCGGPAELGTMLSGVVVRAHLRACLFDMKPARLALASLASHTQNIKASVSIVCCHVCRIHLRCARLLGVCVCAYDG